MDDESTPRVATAKRARMSSVSSQLTKATKVAALDHAQPEPAAVRCELPPHGTMTFADTTAYETHYRAEHLNRCTECHNNFPTLHFLELHISEEHDPIAAAKRDAGEKTYGCFIEGCEKVCSDWRKRRSHLVDKHGFPRNYDFFIVQTGIDGRRSLLRADVDAQGHRKSSRDRSGSLDSASSRGTAVSPQMSEPDVQRHNAARGQGTSAVTSDVKTNIDLSMGAGLDNLTSGMSALRMVPRSVHFGRKKGKTGLVKG